MKRGLEHEHLCVPCVPRGLERNVSGVQDQKALAPQYRALLRRERAPIRRLDPHPCRTVDPRPRRVEHECEQVLDLLIHRARHKRGSRRQGQRAKWHGSEPAVCWTANTTAAWGQTESGEAGGGRHGNERAHRPARGTSGLHSVRHVSSALGPDVRSRAWVQ